MDGWKKDSKVYLHENAPHGNPHVEILMFCKSTALSHQERSIPTGFSYQGTDAYRMGKDSLFLSYIPHANLFNHTATYVAKQTP